LRFAEDETDPGGDIRILDPVAGGPGDRAGITGGQTLRRIDGRSVAGLSAGDVAARLVGRLGSDVTLTLGMPDGSEREVRVTRSPIPRPSPVEGFRKMPGSDSDWDFFQADPLTQPPAARVAYIRIKAFTKDTSDGLRAALNRCQAGGATSLVLDLRDNSGGLLTAVGQCADQFMDKGVIYRTKVTGGESATPGAGATISATHDDDDVTLPLVVLVNDYTASGAELLAGTLQEHHRALIVGGRTMGLGTVQMLFPLGGRDAYLKVTTSRLQLASGRMIQRDRGSREWGVTPDIAVPETHVRSSRTTSKPVDADDVPLSVGLLVQRLRTSGQ
jgi:carboxyl-terminal processing protease